MCQNPGGFTEWSVGSGDEDSYAFTIAPPEHWDLVDCVAIVSAENPWVFPALREESTRRSGKTQHADPCLGSFLQYEAGQVYRRS